MRARVRKPAVAIVGLGLIGGSLARALTRAGYGVIGVDRDSVRRRAVRAGAVAGTAGTVEAVARMDVIVLAAPPAANLRLLKRLARVARPGVVITDVGSVKRPIVQEAARLGLDGFVGGHPMAGTEGAGFPASSPDLFLRRPWVLAPSPDEAATRSVRSLVRAVGARPVEVTPAVHDRAVAFLSHLPQLVAWALSGAAAGDVVAARWLSLAGPGYHDMTRLARSPRDLWREILGQNEPEVSRALDAFVRELRRSWRPGPSAARK
jgi:prephenate dehydrogenase